jgi:hypothetical protein
MRNRLDAGAAEYLRLAISGDAPSAVEFASSAFRDLEPDDLEVVVESFGDVVTAIDEVNCAAYGIDPVVITEYKASLTSAPAPGQRFGHRKQNRRTAKGSRREICINAELWLSEST